MLLQLCDLNLAFGDFTAIDHVSCGFEAGTLTAIVGPNGAGKTTLFNLISGQLRPNSGGIRLDGEDISGLDVPGRTRKGLGRSFQLSQLFPRLKVLENMRLAVIAHRRAGSVFWRTASDMPGVREQALGWLERVGLSSQADKPVSHLAHSDQRRLEIALLLAIEPRVIMLDEPTAGMGMEQVPAMLEIVEGLKQDTGRAILLVEHKMEVVHTLADRIIVLHEGRLIADATPDEAMSSAAVRTVYLGAGA